MILPSEEHWRLINVQRVVRIFVAGIACVTGHVPILYLVDSSLTLLLNHSIDEVLVAGGRGDHLLRLD